MRHKKSLVVFRVSAYLSAAGFLEEPRALAVVVVIQGHSAKESSSSSRRSGRLRQHFIICPAPYSCQEHPGSVRPLALCTVSPANIFRRGVRLS